MSKLFAQKLVTLFAGLMFISVSARGCQADCIKDIKDNEQEIIAYILVTARNEIKNAQYYGRRPAKKFGGINDYTYDCIPFVFFKDENEYRIPLHLLTNDNVIQNICDGIEAYKNDIKQPFSYSLWSGNGINNDEFTKFFHCRAVDSMNLSESEKQLFKEKPMEMEVAVTAQTFDTTQYFEAVFKNYVSRYIIEKKLKEKKS